MNWLSRLIPSRTALAAMLTAAFAGLLAWMRFDAARDAKRDITADLQAKDTQHAKDIRDRVSDSRADPDRLRPYDDAGYRD